MTRHVTVHQQKLHPAQAKVLSEAGQYNVLDMGRRWGKTTFGTRLGMDTALAGYPVGFFYPSYKMILDTWSDLVYRLKPVITRKSVQEKRIELITGGIIEFWSLENSEAIRGKKYKRAISDEIAIVPGYLDIFQKIIQPLLLDLDGSDAWFLSTPQGYNDFWELFRRGEDELKPAWKCWQMPTSTNPFMNLQRLLEIKADVTPTVWEQEYEAQFRLMSGSVFEHVVECATAKTQLKGDPSHLYVFGVDWGDLNDFSVVICWDLTLNEMCFIDRFNKMGYVNQKIRLINLYKKFKPNTILCEVNSMGRPMIDVLADEGLPVQAFDTNSGSKQAIIRDLQSAFAQKSIRIIADQTLINELNSFQTKKLLSGVYSFEAPKSGHDDTVMALAIAYTQVYSGSFIIGGA